MFEWLIARGIWVTKTWLFSVPDAGKDKCLICSEYRDRHEKKGHKFAE